MNDRIPVFITCWNRVTYARAIVEQLKAIDGANPIVVLDNDSTWPPMREWLDSFSGNSIHKIKLESNIGNYCAWEHLRILGITRSVAAAFSNHHSYYVVTDDDMDLSTVPADVLTVLRDVLDAHPDVIKVGLALRIDDLPDAYPLKSHVLREQSQYWVTLREILGIDIRVIPVYEAPIDTTFAMYRMSDLPSHDGVAWRGRKALRVAGAYTARHRPWYVGPDEFTDEDWYALSRSETFTQWTVNMQHWCRARGIVPKFSSTEGH